MSRTARAGWLLDRLGRRGVTAAAAAALILVIGGVGMASTPPTGPAPTEVAAVAPAPARPAPVIQTTASIAPLTAADLQDAYKLPAKLLGSRQTIAVVTAFDYPKAAADLAVYRAQNGLPPCDADFPCFRKVNQRGTETPPPIGNVDWGLSGAIGLQMSAAACPNCRLLLVQADDDTWPNLSAAVDTAAGLGADVVATLFYDQEGQYALAEAPHFNHPGTVIVAAAGQSGFANGIGRQNVPAAFSTVVAVGGTTLFRDESARGWGEQAWSFTGSGCSAYLPKPSWQRSGPCGDKRMVADVAAVANPDTGVAVYDTHGIPGWIAVGGTAVPVGIIAGAYALAGNADTLGGVNAGRQLSRNAGRLFDVTTGNNGACGDMLCTAGRGYDGPSGFGTPNGIGAF